MRIDELMVLSKVLKKYGANKNTTCKSHQVKNNNETDNTLSRSHTHFNAEHAFTPLNFRYLTHFRISLPEQLLSTHQSYFIENITWPAARLYVQISNEFQQ